MREKVGDSVKVVRLDGALPAMTGTIEAISNRTGGLSVKLDTDAGRWKAGETVFVQPWEVEVIP